VKKFIIYLICVVTIGVSGGFYYDHMQSTKYDVLAVPYIKKVLPVLSHWDVEQVKQYLAPEVLQTVSDKNLKTLLTSLSQIGTLESISEIELKNTKSVEDDQGLIVTYDVEAQYSTGPATVTLRLLDMGEGYRLYYFNFQSQALAAQ